MTEQTDVMRLGILGMSEGNGHPYSWSAICNGYDPKVMAGCPFSAIPSYLGMQSWPDARLTTASVTHVWTQDPATSRHIAAAANIPHVVGEAESMIGAVDGVLLARDDDTHPELARPFLEAGLPVLIDKPFAVSMRQAERLWAMQRDEGQIFSCSAIRYAPEFAPGAATRAGAPHHVSAVTAKDWVRYAPHILDPVIRWFGTDIAEAVALHADSRTILSVRWTDERTATFTNSGKAGTPISLHVVGDEGTDMKTAEDTFGAFRTMLSTFVQAQRDPTLVPSRAEVDTSVSLLVRGMA